MVDPVTRYATTTTSSGADRLIFQRADQLSVASTYVNDEPNTEPLRKNRTIDPRLAAGSPWRGQVHRGRLVRRSFTTDGTAGRLIGELHFLFNPTSVSFDYQIDPSKLPPSEQMFPNTVPYIGQQASCSFDLLFDRTYETLSGSSRTGVLEDVAVLEHLMGASLDEDTGIWSAPRGEVISVFFGRERSMSFKGFFTGAKVDMTHFTPEMIPIRLVMSISMQRTMEAEDRVNSMAEGASVLADDKTQGWSSDGSDWKDVYAQEQNEKDIKGGYGDSKHNRPTSEPSQPAGRSSYAGGNRFI